MYCCIQIIWCYIDKGNPVCTRITPTNMQDGTYRFTWVTPSGVSVEFTIEPQGPNYVIIDDHLQQVAMITPTDICPVGSWTLMDPVLYSLTSIDTSETVCKCTKEDRIFKQYEAVILPENNVDEDRGNIDCCCRQLVLGSNSSNTWENDITPIWQKLDASGTAVFKLLKDGAPTNYNLQIKPIIRETNAYYAEVNWGDVLTSDGSGCYSLEIEYNIAGIVGSVIWGNYELKPYSIQNAMYTARVRAVFNSYFYKENIDFTDTNMQGTLRFTGMIGKRQPNTEIDNIIYETREMKSVIRENLNTYEIATDPLDECIIKPLIDLYLLHENNLFISDYNYHNHSYLYKDMPVILEETAEITYYDWSRKASVVAKVGDKVKNNMNYFK